MLSGKQNFNYIFLSNSKMEDKLLATIYWVHTLAMLTKSFSPRVSNSDFTATLISFSACPYTLPLLQLQSRLTDNWRYHQCCLNTPETHIRPRPQNSADSETSYIDNIQGTATSDADHAHLVAIC